MFNSYLQFLNQKWTPVHLLLVKNQKLLIKFFLVLEWLFLLLIPLGFWVRLIKPMNFGYVYELGSKMGTISFLLYLTTLVPGILHRLTYFALFLIFLHVALIELSLGLLGLVMIILEIISWAFVFKTPRPLGTDGNDSDSLNENQGAFGKPPLL